MIARGDVVWADFGLPRGSEPAKRRPVIVVQDNWLLESKINTVLVVPLTSNVALARFPGNVLITAIAANLPDDSVANVTQVGPISREFIEPYPVGQIPAYLLNDVLKGIRLVLGV